MRVYGFEFDDSVKTKEPGKDVLLSEAGPSCRITPATIYSGCFCGELIWENPEYLTVQDLRMRQRAEQEEKRERIAAEK